MTKPTKVIAELLTAENILLDLNVSSKEQVFDAVAQLLQGRAGLAGLPLSESLKARERLGSTALGSGVAVPHARIKGLAQLVAAFVRPCAAIGFDAPDGKPVSSIVVIFVPEQATQAHLQLLAGVAELFQDSRFKERLSQCTDAAGVSRLFADWSNKHG